MTRAGERAEQAAPVGSRVWRAAAAAMFCCGWGGNQFTPLLVMYREAGYSVVAVDALLGAYVVGLVPGLLLTGRLSARFGCRPVMAAGTVLSLLASVLLAVGALGPIPIAVGRFLTGVAVATAMAVGTTWVTELSRHGPARGPPPPTAPCLPRRQSVAPPVGQRFRATPPNRSPRFPVDLSEILCG